MDKKYETSDLWQYMLEFENRVEHRIQELNKKQDQVLNLLLKQNNHLKEIFDKRNEQQANLKQMSCNFNYDLQSPKLSDVQNKPIQVETTTPSNPISPHSMVSRRDYNHRGKNTFNTQYQNHLNSLNSKHRCN